MVGVDVFHAPKVFDKRTKEFNPRASVAAFV